MQIVIPPKLLRLLAFLLKRPLEHTYVRAVAYTITMKPRHPPRVRRKPPPPLKLVQSNQSPVSRLYPKAAAPSPQCGLIKPVPFSPLLPGQSPLSSIITAPATCHMSEPRIARPNKIEYIPVVAGQSPLSSLLAPRHSNCYMLEAPEQLEVPPVAARGSVSTSLALVICLVAAVLPYVFVSRRMISKRVAAILSFNPVSAHDAHSDVADDNDSVTVTSDDGNASLGTMDSDVTLVEHGSGDEARGTSDAVDRDELLFKIAAKELKDMVIAQDCAQKMAGDVPISKEHVMVVEEIQQVQELPTIKCIVDQVTVRGVEQTSDVIGEEGESQPERVSVAHKPRTSRRDKKRRKRGRKPGRKLLRRLMAMA